MDAITIQILRNKIASLVDEMHYHFYRSGYSTIIRESRDFSCVILDRDGRLIVAPPMFFHAPVYRHLVGRILKVYGTAGAIHEGDVFVSNHPYEGGLPHVSDMAFVAPVFADGKIVAFSGSIAHKADVGGAVPGSTSANATEMFHEGLLLPPVKIWDGGEPQPDIERIILTNSRQPALMRGDIHAQIAVTQMGAARVKELCGRFGAGTVTDAFAAILKGAADELRAAIARLPGRHGLGRGLSGQRRRRGRQADQARRHHRDQGRHRELRFLQQRSAGQGAGQSAPLDGRGLRVLFADRQPRAEPAFQRRHARRGAAHIRAAHHRQCRAARPGLQLPDGQSPAGRRDPRSARAFQSRPRHGAFRRVERARHRLVEGPPGPVHHAVRDRRLRLWRRPRPRRRDRDRDASEQPAHHADRDPRIRISLPHHALRPGAGFRRRRANGAAASPCSANTSCWKTPPSSAVSTRPAFRPRASPAARTAAAPASWCASARRRNSRRRPRRASTCRRASASCCKAPAAAATAIPRGATRAAVARDIAEGYVTADATTARRLTVELGSITRLCPRGSE